MVVNLFKIFDTLAQTGGLRCGEGKMGSGNSLKKKGFEDCGRGGLRWSLGGGIVYSINALCVKPLRNWEIKNLPK